ncbi:MAG: aminopeptidase P family protein [Muribaculaceae bacterium]|nr:aminopeptidase P family protein [Muribaculaceae bacterium]
MEKNIISLVPTGLEGEIRLHIEKVKRQLEPGSALLVSGNVNVFYTTGRFFRGYVWIPAEGEPVYFVVKPRVYSGGTEKMEYIRKPEQIPSLLVEMGYEMPRKVGLEESELTYNDTLRLMKLFPDAEVFDSTPVLRNARMVKTPMEIELMRYDGERQAQAYSKVSGLYRSGMTDVELQIEIERELRKLGCLGYPRVAGNLMEINMGSVLAGDNADTPSPYEFAMGGAGADPSLPGGADGHVIGRHETVMIDMNGSFNAYQTDMTRVWTAGELPELAEKAQRCSERILRTLEREALPGREVCELYFRAVEIAEGEGLKDYFMGHSQQSGFIGHGVGIELNEQPPVAPRCKTVLQEGMTLALEPKFVIPGTGPVGVENTYVVRADGLECITHFPEAIQKFDGATDQQG